MTSACNAGPSRHGAAGAQDNDEPARPAGDEQLNALRQVFHEMPESVLRALQRLMSRPSRPWPLEHVLKLAHQHRQHSSSARQGLPRTPHPVKADSQIVADLIHVFLSQCVSSNQVPPNHPADSRV